MNFLRTPDARFLDLPGYPWAPNYLSSLPCAPGGRLHYVEQGQGRDTYLCLHGNPAWSYLYRHMIPVFAREGRVIAPDLFGFGRSDKPALESAHSIDWHRQVLIDFIRQLDLRQITLVVQDWGGILGLTLPMEFPDRIRRLVVMNTALATGEDVPEGFLQWRAYAETQPDLAIGRLLRRGNPQLGAAEAAAYDAPYPDATYKAAIRRFPNLFPLQPDAPGAALSREARDFLSHHWTGASFMAVGAADPVFGLTHMQRLRTCIRGCPDPMVLPHAGHFVQEHGAVIAEAALAAWR
jgi:tRNA(adenine34) deaminase